MPGLEQGAEAALLRESRYVDGQQLGVRGLDLHLGVQRIFRRGVHYSLGATLSHTHLP